VVALTDGILHILEKNDLAPYTPAQILFDSPPCGKPGRAATTGAEGKELDSGGGDLLGTLLADGRHPANPRQKRTRPENTLHETLLYFSLFGLTNLVSPDYPVLRLMDLYRRSSVST
jgi:hypothetical protein